VSPCIDDNFVEQRTFAPFRIEAEETGVTASSKTDLRVGDGDKRQLTLTTGKAGTSLRENHHVLPGSVDDAADQIAAIAATYKAYPFKGRNLATKASRDTDFTVSTAARTILQLKHDLLRAQQGPPKRQSS